MLLLARGTASALLRSQLIGCSKFCHSNSGGSVGTLNDELRSQSNSTLPAHATDPFFLKEACKVTAWLFSLTILQYHMISTNILHNIKALISSQKRSNKPFHRRGFHNIFQSRESVILVSKPSFLQTSIARK